MGLLDEFTLIKDNDKKPFITIRDRSVTFNINSIELLEYTPYVVLLVDNKNRRIAIKKASEAVEGALSFFEKPKEGRSILVRWSGKERTKYFLDMVSNKDELTKGVRIFGEYYKEEKVIIYNF